MSKLSHYGKRGEVQMVDVSAKQVTTRSAKAHGFVKMKPRLVAAGRRLKKPKGNPLGVAVTAAALTVYDMCKALDKGMEITDIYLVEKTGGKSGDFHRVEGQRRVPRSRKR